MDGTPTDTCPGPPQVTPGGAPPAHASCGSRGPACRPGADAPGTLPPGARGADVWPQTLGFFLKEALLRLRPPVWPVKASPSVLQEGLRKGSPLSPPPRPRIESKDPRPRAAPPEAPALGGSLLAGVAGKPFR